MTAYKTLHVSEDGPLVTITIDRQAQLNALSREVLTELAAAAHGIVESRARVVALTGAGEKSFVAGADIAEMAQISPREAEQLSELGGNIGRLIEAAKQPWIAQVNGFALGGGCELALSCTMRIASRNAKLGQPEVKLGILPGYGGTQRLPRLCGKGVAHEMILSGEMITADDALRVGLVNRVVDLAELLPAAESIAKKIIANAPLAVKYAMEAVERGMEMPQEEGLFLEATLFGLCCATEDMREGTRAFLEKRPAKFQGH